MVFKRKGNFWASQIGRNDLRGVKDVTRVSESCRGDASRRSITTKIFSRYDC